MTRARTFASTLLIPTLLGLSACTSTISLGTDDTTSSSTGAMEYHGDPSLCTTGPITAIAATPSPTALLLDHDAVYWLDDPAIEQINEYQPKHLMSLSKSGGAPATLATGSRFDTIMLDDLTLYWVGENAADPTSVSLYSMAKTGGAITTLNTVTGGMALVGVDSDRIYLQSGYEGALFSMPKAGGGLTQLVAKMPGVIRILIDATNLYWTSKTQAFSMPKSGGTPVVLTSALHGDVLALLDDETLYFYWRNEERSTLTLPKSGGSPTVLHNGMFPRGLDDHCLYESPLEAGVGVETPDKPLLGVPKSGGVPAVIAPGMTMVSAIVGDDSGLYWTDSSAGRVMRMAR